MNKHKISFEYSELQYSEIGEKDNSLIESARKAAENAYAPYSGFRVGASCSLANGKSFSASNQENAAYPSGLCAERVVLFFAGSKYPNVEITNLAIVALSENGEIIDKPVPPCGACRQVIAETTSKHNHPIRLLLAGKNSVLVFENADDLLPLLFDTSFLK